LSWSVGFSNLTPFPYLPLSNEIPEDVPSKPVLSFSVFPSKCERKRTSGVKASALTDSAGDMYAVWIENVATEGSIWDDSQTRWEDSAGAVNTGGNNVDAIDTGVSGLENNMSAVVDNTNVDIHLAYISDEATDQVSYRRWDNGTVTWDAVTLVADAASNDDAYVTISYDTSGDDVYVLWIDTGAADDIFYSKCDISTECDVAGEWDAEINWQNTGTNTYVTSNYSGAGSIFAQWTEGTASPYSIMWDYIIIIPEHLWLFFGLGPLLPLLLKRRKDRRI